MLQNAGKYIRFIGIILVLAGLIFMIWGEKFRWIGHLPGDIRIERANFMFYFPFTTLVLASVVITLLFNLIKRIL